jgi:hypothetical protein
VAHAGLNFASVRPADRRRAMILAGSVALHAAILLPMAFGLLNSDLPVLTPAYTPPIFVEMEPRPLLEGETAREPAPASAAAREQAPVLGETLPSLARDRSREEDEDEDRPTAPVPRIGAAPPSDAPAAPDDPWRVIPETGRAAVARSLRTGPVGCRMMDGRLSESEQRLCDDRFNEAAGRAGPLGPRSLTPSEQRRDAQFAREGARALHNYEALRRPLGPGTGNVGPGDCPGSNLGMGCAGAHLDPALRQGATTTVNPGMTRGGPDSMRPIPGND